MSNDYRPGQKMYRHCHTFGHNVRTCNKLREDAKNPDNYWSQKKLANVEARTEHFSANRACSYCKLGGHNRATCAKIISDKLEAIRKNRIFRSAAYELMQHYGIGIGTMFEYKPNSQWSDESHLFIVEKINWNNVNYKGNDKVIDVIENGESMPYYSFPINADFFNSLEQGKKFILIEGCSESVIGSGMPKDWLAGKTKLEAVFKP